VKLQEYPDRFLDCRAFGHSWMRGKEVYTAGRAARLVYRRYDQPEGYRNSEAFTPSEYKAELFRRENRRSAV